MEEREVGTGIVAAGAGQPERGDRDDDEAWVALPKLLGCSALEGGECAIPAEEDEVGASEGLRDVLGGSVRGEALVGVERDEGGSHGAFEDDHLRAEVSQHPSGDGDRALGACLEDAHAGEGVPRTASHAAGSGASGAFTIVCCQPRQPEAR